MRAGKQKRARREDGGACDAREVVHMDGAREDDAAHFGSDAPAATQLGWGAWRLFAADHLLVLTKF